MLVLLVNHISLSSKINVVSFVLLLFNFVDHLVLSCHVYLLSMLTFQAVVPYSYIQLTRKPPNMGRYLKIFTFEVGIEGRRLTSFVSEVNYQIHSGKPCPVIYTCIILYVFIYTNCICKPVQYNIKPRNRPRLHSIVF